MEKSPKAYSNGLDEYVKIYDEESLQNAVRISMEFLGNLNDPYIEEIYGSACRDILMTGSTDVTTVAEFIGDKLDECRKVFDGLRDRLVLEEVTETEHWKIEGFVSDEERAGLIMMYNVEMIYTGDCRIDVTDDFEGEDDKRAYRDTYRSFKRFLKSRLRKSDVAQNATT